jgi:hypothetical protein
MVAAPSTSETPEPQARQQQLIAVMGRLIPLVDGLTAKLRNVLVIGWLFLGWIAVWLGWIKGVSLITTLILTTVASLPLFLILRFWWVLSDLKQLPGTANKMLSDASGKVQANLQELRAAKTPRLGIISSIKGLWSVGALADEARDLLGSYLNFGILVNPLILVLGVLSLLFVLLLVLTGSMLAIFTIF